MGAQQEIDRIDQELDANQRDLLRLARFMPNSAWDWQHCYDRWPHLRARRNELYRQRGEAQVRRDEEEHRAWQVAHRAEQRRVRSAILAKQKRERAIERQIEAIKNEMFERNDAGGLGDELAELKAELRGLYGQVAA